MGLRRAHERAREPRPNVLLEREEELAALEDAVRAARSGAGCLVLVGGEAGIGKTSLVRGLGGRAGGDATVLVGACEPLSVPVPLAPLRELAEAADVPDLIEAEAADRVALARRLLRALAARAPAVAVIEDAHWADPATIDVVRLLARRVERAPVAVVVTYRDDEVDANPGLRQLLGDVATRPTVRRLALRPLSQAAVGELAEPVGLDPARLARITGGNPFLVVEAVAAGGRLPASVRDAALARVSRLSPEARDAVDAAAVLGQRVDPALLAAVAPGSAGAVEEAVARGVLVADGAALGFRHELTRDAIEGSIPPPRRAALHARVVAALAARAGTADHARLAHHAELAGLVDQASRYAALAAAEAERVGALRETSLQAERALRLGRALGDEERLELLLRHSHAANFANTRLEDAAESAEEAIELAARRGDPVRQGRGLVALASALWSLDRVEAARAAADRAVAVLEGAGDVAALARAHATRVRMEATAFDPELAIELGPRALDLAARAGLEETRLDVAISVGLARGHRGDPEALTVLADAARAVRERGLAVQTVRTYVNLVYVAWTLRRHEVVDAGAAEALALFEDYQTTIPAFAVDFYRGRSLFDRGRFAEAEAIASAPGRNWAAETPVVLAVLGLLAARRGAAGAEELLAQAWATIRQVPEGSRHGTIRAALVEAAWLRGDGAEALRHLRETQASRTMRFTRPASDLALWARRLGGELPAPANAPEPVVLELAGDWRGAVRAWRELDAPYEAALAALPGDEPAAREAVRALRALGLPAAARAFAREREALGARPLRGPRQSTLRHPAGLTRREQEVLEVLATGATNAATAARLHLSERTVAHHVSAVLRKLDAPTRAAAVEHGRRLGLLGDVAQDGHPEPRT